MHENIIPHAASRCERRINAMVKQVSVFLENRAGRLNQILKILSDSGINITSLSIADTGEYGIARLITEDHEKALKALNDGGMTAAETEVLAIEVSDKPGALYNATKTLTDNDINVEYAYSAIPSEAGRAIIIIRVDDLAKATQIISKAEGITSLDKI